MLLLLHWFTTLICLGPSSLQYCTPPSSFIFLVSPYCVSSFSSTRTLTLKPQPSSSCHFCVCFCATVTRTELCDIVTTPLAHYTHLPNNLNAAISFASITIHTFSRSLLFLDVFFDGHTDTVAKTRRTLSLLRPPFVHTGLYRALCQNYRSTRSLHSSGYHTPDL